MFYSALRYVYRSCSRHSFVGRITQCLAQPSQCHQSLRFTCAVSQLRRRSPHMMWGWTMGRVTTGTELSYSTKTIKEDELNYLIRHSQVHLEREAKEYLMQDGMSEGEIISDYENGPREAEKDLGGLLPYIYAVSLKCLRDSPRYQNTHLLQDDRLSSALLTILDKGLMEGSVPRQLIGLLLVGVLIQPSPEILQFYKELERHMSQVWSEWHVKIRIDACHRWLRLSVLYKQNYLEEQIRIFLKHLMSEVKLERKELGGKEIHWLVSVLESATHYSCELGGKWVDENDVRHFLQELKFNSEFSEPREVYRYVQLCHNVEYLVPSDILWKGLEILLCDGTEEYKIRAFLCIKWMLGLAQKQKLNKGFMDVQYVTELAEIFKKHASLLPLRHQIGITWQFGIMYYSDHEMLLKVAENFVANAQDIDGDGGYRLVQAYLLMDCNTNIAFLKKVVDLVQNQGRNIPPFKLLSIACDLMCRHGYYEVFSGILDSCFQSGLMKEESLNVMKPKGFINIVELCGRLEIEQIDKYVEKIPPSLYKADGIQHCAEKLKIRCQHSSTQAVSAAVRRILGGPHMARVTPVLPIYRPVVEFCLNELNEPVDMKLVPRVLDENGFLKMENMSALPERWRRIAVWILHDKDFFINKPMLTGEAKAKKHFLYQAGYREVLEVPFFMVEEKSASLHKFLKEELEKIPHIRLPNN
ncbi:uncharacterized protein LOC106159999 isoform X2 [Lingula anatina]|uniref:Uncharacterized protein LOC106159999 isoform X1 n=1 Tax=Lingula anatina TaxID=7574 RepID=A0A1S3I3K8_LINAN|nr:uncharacterized protein LOC106159999 isoform X1 [Lingula anatina]XP_013391944.1 uncharacterized protein LOC106159999 isoform X2 [Lingula anatina]|eukprot:XP_013391943.1 uncharacterized protein LOC106159999 isoform X1 [Lingula anatina]